MTVKQHDSATSISIEDCFQLAKSAESLSLRPRIIRNQQSGQYMSKLRGRGMEFDELRLYQAGDDIRAIDWNVTARTGKAHTKLYREERDRPVIFCLDLRPNMFFATRVAYKAVIAAKITALLAWTASKNGDKIGGFIFSDKEQLEQRPKNGRKALSHWFKNMAEHPVWQESVQPEENPLQSWQDNLKRLSTVTHPGSLVFIISDFLDVTTADKPYINKLAKHNEVHFIQVNDIIETQLPQAGNITVKQLDKSIQVNTSAKKIREQYEQYFSNHQLSLQKLCRKENIQLCSLFTHDNIISKLQNRYGKRR